MTEEVLSSTAPNDGFQIEPEPDTNSIEDFVASTTNNSTSPPDEDSATSSRELPASPFEELGTSSSESASSPFEELGSTSGESIVSPDEKSITPPTELTLPPVEDVVPSPNESTLPPVEEFVPPPNESTIPPVEEFVSSTSEFTLPPIEEFVSSTSEPTLPPVEELVTSSRKSKLPVTGRRISTSGESTPTSSNRTFAPLNTPFYRRRQTLTILVWFLMPWFCLYLSLCCLRSNNWYVFYGFLTYLTWMVFFRKYPRQGGLRQQWFRRLAWWKWFADYFPIHLHKTCDLPADRSYIFGYHPHGIISLGAFCNFATEGTDFEEKFPNINLRLLTLKSNFRIPFYGFYLTLLGLCDASKESCSYILEKGNGNSILLVLGGAKEALDARPSSEYILTLKNRKGFVKIALTHGASLVPVFSFGENDLYDQVANPRGSRLRDLQMLLQKRMGYAMPFFKGRGIFQYAVGFLPKRRPIHTYVGEPIPLPKMERNTITQEIIDQYHETYMQALVQLFDTHKAKHDNKDSTIKIVNDNDW